MAKFGNSDIDKLYFGNDEVDKVYLGTDVIYENYPTSQTVMTVNKATNYTLQLYKEDTKPTKIYVDDNLYTTSTTAGLQYIDINIVENQNINHSIKIKNTGVWHLGSYCLGSSSLNENLIEVDFTSEFLMNTIDSYCFYNCTNITSVSVPTSVNFISSYAFQGCTSLQRAYLYCDLGSSAFDYCINLSSLFLSEGITTISNSAFSRCSSLVEVILPSTLTTLGEYAFSDCINLTSINIPSNISTLTTRLFAGCSSLTHLNIPANITRIENYSLTIGTSSDKAIITFENTSPCTLLANSFDTDKLSKIMVPANCKSAYIADTSSVWYSVKDYIEEISQTILIVNNNGWYSYDLNIYKEDSLQTAVYLNGELYETSIQSGSQTITIVAPNGTNTIKLVNMGNWYFNNYCLGTQNKNYNLTSLNISGENKMTAVGDYAFCGCSQLFAGISLPKSVKSIGAFSFSVSKITSVSMYYGISSIGQGAFSSCSSLQRIILPNSITAIGSSAFSDCLALSYIVLPANLTSIPSSMLDGCEGLKNLTIPSTVTSIGQYALRIGNTASKAIITFESSTPCSIKSQTLNSTYLTNVIVPANCTSAYKSSWESTWSSARTKVCDETCLAFYSYTSFTLGTYDSSAGWNGTIEYSTDRSNWYVWDGTTTLSSSLNQLFLRGVNNTRITASDSKRFVLTGNYISCVGNIEHLLDYQKVASITSFEIDNFCFRSLFYECSSLLKAPRLDNTITSLSSYCYSSMFEKCTNLTATPLLLSTSLASGCYQRMFNGCTLLDTVFSLPATELASSCYSGMFNGCRALTHAPSLNATTLASNCYAEMFYYCTSLTTLPQLPATTLQSYCYYGMFRYCSNIKLSLTKVDEYQTAYRIPTSGTGTTASSALSSMFLNTGGTWANVPSINTTYYTSNTIV